MRITVSVEGELVPKGMQDLTADTPMIGRQQIRTTMERVKRRMQEYPPEPPRRERRGTHAVLGTIITKTGRTGNLGAKWAIIKNDDGYTLENTATRKGRAYGRYVVGGADGTGQAWMHQGRWQLLRDVVEEETAKLPGEIEEKIRMIARKTGADVQ